MTPAELHAIYPQCDDPEKYAAIISVAWAEFGMTDRIARAGWLGIIGGETGGQLQVKRENMMYSASRGNEVFGSRGVRCQHLAPIDDNGRVVSNDHGAAYAACVYGNMYGNGPPETMDGWNYRGGGIIGITFKPTYKLCGDALGVDLVASPDRLGEPELSVRAAVWFCTVLKPQCHDLLKVDGEATFLTAAHMVGTPADAAATQRRLSFRRTALGIVGGDQAVPIAHSRTLRAGDSGEDVRALQRALNAQNADLLGDDGVFDGTVYLAVQRFQAEHGFFVDGIAGKQTLTALGLWRV